MQEKQEAAARVDSPNDRKRIALLNGACGQADRIRVCGQVVDVPISEDQKTEVWEPFFGLPKSLINSIRPMQDLTMRAVRRPRLQIEILGVRPREFKQTEEQSYPVLFTSEQFTANDDSFFAHEISSELAPGSYVVRVMLRGIDSLRQSASDLAYIRNADSLILKKDIAIGYGKLRVLGADFDGLLLTSDIDQTFLATPIHSRQGLVETLFQTPDAKHAIPGLPEFYQQVAQTRDPHVPMLFISASPHFFRRTLAAVFDHYDIEFAGLHLKYLLSTFDSILKKVTDTVFNINEFLGQGLGPSFERTLKFFGSSIQSLFDQISYKLTTLLENRLMQPGGAREILMGDNTEGDYFIFTLYQYLLLGRLTGRELEDYLYRLNFLDREALTRDAARRIAKLVDQNLEMHGPRNSVEDVWINLCPAPAADQAQMLERIGQSLPENLAQSFQTGDPEIVRPIACKAGVGFALAAWDSGILNEDQVKKIVSRALGETYMDETFDREAIRAILEGFQPRNAELPSGSELSERIL